MIEIRPYAEDAEHLAGFINHVWRQSYAGKMAFPVWTGDYFRWQLSWFDGPAPATVLAAYDGQQLAGVLIGSPRLFHLSGRPLKGSIWSWLSIDPQYQGRKIAVQLDRARMELMKQIDAELVVSYRFVGSKHSRAERPNSNNASKQFLLKLGFWIRVLDPVQMQRWDLKRWEGFLGLLSYPVAGIPGAGQHESAIRPLEQRDLLEISRLLQQKTADYALSVDWQEQELRQQLLSHRLSQTLVYEMAGEVQGFVNFYRLPFQGRITAEIGLFDIICVDRLTSSAGTALVNAAMRTLREQGAFLAMKIRTGDVPVSVMLRSRWAPTLPESHLVLQWIGPKQPIISALPLHLLWR